MPKQKHDYNALKLEFFQSDIDEAKVFIEHKYGKGKRSGSRARQTTGRSKEKQEYKERIMEKALMINANKQAKELEIPIAQLSLAKKNAVIKVIKKMMEADLDLTDLERTIKIIRTEMGLPTTYSKNENMNTEKIEGIHIVMGGNLIDNNKNIENNAS